MRIKYFFGVSCSLGAIQRVIRQHGLTRKRKQKTEKKRDLRAVKAKRPSMTHIQMDLKHLYDIPNYWEQLKPLGLPTYQYTMRDTKSGMLFLGYSDELSELNARTMTNYVLAEIKLDLPFDIKELTIQTDNGSEFSGQARRVETSNHEKDPLGGHLKGPTWRSFKWTHLAVTEMDPPGGHSKRPTWRSPKRTHLAVI